MWGIIIASFLVNTCALIYVYTCIVKYWTFHACNSFTYVEEEGRGYQALTLDEKTMSNLSISPPSTFKTFTVLCVLHHLPFTGKKLTLQVGEINSVPFENLLKFIQ